jgi:threonine/homoserine/homoserine lactone efflux protein
MYITFAGFQMKNGGFIEDETTFKSNNQQKRKIFEGLATTISNRGFMGDY